MPSFGKRSRECLESSHPVLRLIFGEVIKHYDCSILCGYRGKTEQNAVYKSGASREKWPNSPHNKKTSLAVDAYPFVNGKVSFDHVQCGVLAGFVLAVAYQFGVRDMIVWGGDWDGDQDTNDQELHDLGHFEVRQK